MKEQTKDQGGGGPFAVGVSGSKAGSHLRKRAKQGGRKKNFFPSTSDQKYGHNI